MTNRKDVEGFLFNRIVAIAADDLKKGEWCIWDQQAGALRKITDEDRAAWAGTDAFRPEDAAPPDEPGAHSWENDGGIEITGNECT